MTPVTTTSLPCSSRRLQKQRGQTIIVALLVLLILGMVGAVFIVVVARNLVNARHANRVLTADNYAKSGILFADAQLTYSPLGADWRPPLQNIVATPPTEPREQGRYNAAVTANGLNMPNPSDPDATYLSAGFTRYNTGAGRYLLRLTYTPVLLKDTSGSLYDPVVGVDNKGQAFAPITVPPGRYIKIEAIGREGVIDQSDPTTYSNNRSSDKTQAYLVAYKPIGITDYDRFETNPDKRSDIANLGVVSQLYASDPGARIDGEIVTPGAYDLDYAQTPSGPFIYPVLTTYGAPDAFLKTTVNGQTQIFPNPAAGTGQAAPPNYTLVPGGGSLRANMTTRFFGKNIVYLSDAGAQAPLYQDTMEIAGDLLLDNYDPVDPLNNTGSLKGAGQRASLVLNPPVNPPANSTTPIVDYVSPSSDTGANGGFDTKNSLIRDGSGQNDKNGLPRGIARLEPPLMDTVDPASGLPRYKMLTMTSAPRIDPSTNAPYSGATAGQYGYGQRIYINNPADVQPNSATIGGGSTLMDEWLHRSTTSQPDTKGGWNGDFYNPPGVNITLGRHKTRIKGVETIVYGMRLTRSDTGTPSKTFAWTDAAGNALTSIAPDGTTASSMVVSYDSVSASNDLTANPSNLTGTALSSYQNNPNNDVLVYLEGNVRIHGIVSPNEGTASNPNFIPRHVTIVTNGTAYIDGNLLKGSPDSSITVLAHDYVCVNTTQFLAGPQVDENPYGSPSPTYVSDHGYNALDFSQNGSLLVQEFNFGLPNGDTPAKHYGANTQFGLYVSGRSDGGNLSTTADIDVIDPASLPVNDQNVNGSPPFTPPPPSPPAPRLPPFFQPFNGNAQYFFNLTSSLSNLVESDVRHLYIRRGQNSQQNFQMERAAILPMDIRIEAVLYAQTGSFFVIPGAWFNSNASDTLDTFAPTVTGTVLAGIRPVNTDRQFPFFGQPIDMKITIDGAVSEAQPADIAAQSAWMLKWGWIPQYHGSPFITPPATTPAPEPAGHRNATAGSPAIGLQIIYNPQAGYPYAYNSTGNAGGGYYLRSDVFGRPLPFTPNLPVSTGLLYAGQSGEAPLLQ